MSYQIFTPPPAPVQTYDTTWLLDVGAFFDRFGAVKMAILTSTDTTVKAIVTDAMSRKWIDLKRTDLAQALNSLVGLLSAQGMTAALRDSIINTPAAPNEQLALIKLYFS